MFNLEIVIEYGNLQMKEVEIDKVLLLNAMIEYNNLKEKQLPDKVSTWTFALNKTTFEKKTVKPDKIELGFDERLP